MVGMSCHILEKKRSCVHGIMQMAVKLFYTYFNGFGTWPKWPLPPLHFGDLRGAIMCHCWINQNGTVRDVKSEVGVTFIKDM